MVPQLQAFFDPATWTVTHVVHDGAAAAVIDPVLDYEPKSGRTSFPSFGHLSIRRLLALPGETRLFMCHDYPPAGRGPEWQSKVAEQRARNIHVHDGVSEDQFVALRTARDRTLGMPTLILPAIQVNIRAGELPPPEDDGRSYLKIPLNAL